MANVTIPSLPSAGAIQDTDLLVLQQAATSKVAASVLKTYVSATTYFASNTFSGAGTSGSPYTLITDTTVTSGSSNPITSGGVYTAIQTVASTPGGSTGNVQFNNAGVLGGAATFNWAAGLLYISGANYDTVSINAANYPNINFLHGGTLYCAIGGGNSGTFTNSNDWSIVSTSGRVSIETPANGLFLNGTGQLGLGTGNITWIASSATNVNAAWNYGSGITTMYIGNAQSLIGTPQNNKDFLIGGPQNVGIMATVIDQTSVYAQFNESTKSLILNGGASGGFTGDSNLLLQTVSTTRGVSFSPMTTTQKNAISSPTESMIVYDNVLHNYYFWNGSAWTAF